MAGLSCGIVGLPNVGKSSLYNALTKNLADSSNYPFCTIDPNVGVVEVSDPRLEKLSKLSKSKKILYATMEFVDIAGLVKGASQGEGLGNKFLSNIRETDAIIHVVRCFDSDDITHVAGRVDPVADVEVINLELILADLQSVESIIVKMGKKAKADKELKDVLQTLEKVKQHLNDEKPVISLDLSDEEKEQLKPYPLLTQKKVLYVANVDEKSAKSENEYVKRLREHVDKEGSKVLCICAQFEEQIASFDEEEEKEFLASLGLEEPGLQRLIRESFSLLGLMTFITSGELETRAWTIRKGQKAPEAAGKIHSDIQKGFIRAEVVSFDDMMAFSGRIGARENGKARSEGKEYIVQDGDVILFFHN